MSRETWPELSYIKGKETYQTIHLWSQILGKVKLAAMPWINHSWHITLFVTPGGLTTGDMSVNGKHFNINLNFLKHQLEIKTSENEERIFSLRSLSVAGCYRSILKTLKELEIRVRIYPIPNELENPTRLDEDEHHTYVAEVAESLHYAFLKSNEIFTKFRAGFIGKSSPVHFFWGSFDLAVSRFSGLTAPPHPGGIPNLPDRVAQEAYSHEVSSCGFWPGNDMVPFAAYYCYLYPEPDGYNKSSVIPGAAYYHKELKEFILPYEDVRNAEDPSETLLDFLNSTYSAGADLANWDRKNLERQKIFV